MRELVPACPPGASPSTSNVLRPSDAPYTAAPRPARLHEEVVVQGHVVDRADGGLSVRIRGKQHALGVGEDLDGLFEKRYARHTRHPMVYEEHGDGHVAEFQVPHQLERRFAGTALTTRYCRPYSWRRSRATAPSTIGSSST